MCWYDKECNSSTYRVLDFPNWWSISNFENVYWLLGFWNIPHFDGVVCSAAHQLVLFDWTKIQCIYFAGMSINVMLRTIWVPYIPNLYWIEMWGGQVFTRYSFPTNLSVINHYNFMSCILWITIISEDFLKQVLQCCCFMNSHFFCLYVDFPPFTLSQIKSYYRIVQNPCRIQNIGP